MPRQIPQPWCTSQYVYLLSLLGDEDFIKSGSSFEPVNQPDPCKIYIITFILHPNPYHFDKFTFIFHFCFLQQTWQKKHMSNEKSFKVLQFWFTLSEPKSGDFSQHHDNLDISQQWRYRRHSDNHVKYVFGTGFHAMKLSTTFIPSRNLNIYCNGLQ